MVRRRSGGNQTDVTCRSSMCKSRRQDLAIWLGVLPCVVGERPGGIWPGFGEPPWLEPKRGQSKGWDRSEGPNRLPSLDLGSD